MWGLALSDANKDLLIWGCGDWGSLGDLLTRAEFCQACSNGNHSQVPNFHQNMRCLNLTT